MPRKKYTPEEIVAKLRQVDVLVSQGHAIADAVRQSGCVPSTAITSGPTTLSRTAPTMDENIACST